MFKHSYWIGALLLFCVVGFQNCSTKSTAVDETKILAANSARYFQKMTHLYLDVYYEPGSEPFTGTNPSGYPYWNVLEENLNAIFQYRSSPPQITLPKNLSEMTALPSQNRTLWTTEQLVQLAQAHKVASSDPNVVRFQVLFLDGYLEDNGAPNTSVIGVSISGTTVIAMFKQVVESTGANPMGPVPKFVEQSTLVHEMGHALGFVNNGVPMSTPHQDSAHGAHTTNNDCVMYYLNEGSSDLVQFIQKYLASSSRVMWGPEVLADAKALSK